MKWFRLYTEVKDDPKIRDLTAKEFRIFIYLLCLAAEFEEDGDIPLNLKDIAWRLRIGAKSLENVVKKLVSCSICVRFDEKMSFINWKKRQFKSDDVTSRTRKYKEKQIGSEKRERSPERSRYREEKRRKETEERNVPDAGQTPPPTAPKNGAEASLRPKEISEDVKAAIRKLSGNVKNVEELDEAEKEKRLAKLKEQAEQLKATAEQQSC